MEPNVELFEKYTNQMTSGAKKRFVIKALGQVPEYFWSVPAASTRKAHPSFAHGDGGLVRHTIFALDIALEMFAAYPELQDEDKDNIIVALILHDSIKNGHNQQPKSVKDHPILPYDHFKELSDKFLEVEEYDTIMYMIRAHMGIWGPDGVEGAPDTLDGYRVSPAEIVHIADYIASRTCLDRFPIVGKIGRC